MNFTHHSERRPWPHRPHPYSNDVRNDFATLRDNSHNHAFAGRAAAGSHYTPLVTPPKARIDPQQQQRGFYRGVNNNNDGDVNGFYAKQQQARFNQRLAGCGGQREELSYTTTTMARRRWSSEVEEEEHKANERDNQSPSNGSTNGGTSSLDSNGDSSSPFPTTDETATPPLHFNGGDNYSVDSQQDRDKRLLELTDRTGYSIVQRNGQRIFGGPPPDWSGPPPGKGCEIFVGKVPRNCTEADLVPIFAKVGRIFELRLMMDFSGSNRGYFFVRYCTHEDAKRAVRELNNFEIRPRKRLGVLLSVDNRRLWVSGIPKNRSAAEIRGEMARLTEGVRNVILYPSQTDKSKTRGYAFVEYESHRAAALARRTLVPKKNYLFGQEIEKVDWAEPEQEVDEETMSKVRVLFLRNLQPMTTENQLRCLFEDLGNEDLERVKKAKDYAFIHFRTREAAQRAIDQCDDLVIDDANVEVTWSKPVDKNNHNQRKMLTKMLSGSTTNGNFEHSNMLPYGMGMPFVPQHQQSRPSAFNGAGPNSIRMFAPRAPGTTPPRRLLKMTEPMSSPYGTAPIGTPRSDGHSSNGVITPPQLNGNGTNQQTAAGNSVPIYNPFSLYGQQAPMYFPPPTQQQMTDAAMAAVFTYQQQQQVASFFTPATNMLPMMQPPNSASGSNGTAVAPATTNGGESMSLPADPIALSSAMAALTVGEEKTVANGELPASLKAF